MKKIIFFTCSFLSIIILKAQYYGGNGGGFSVASSGNSAVALPVDLLYFEAKAKDNQQAQLFWQTASELNNNYFDVERSYNAKHWEWLGNVTGEGTTNKITNYSFIDKTIAKGQKTAYYRLNQVDYDGAHEYTEIRQVRFTSELNIFDVSSYPNPCHYEVTLLINSIEPYNIEVTNLSGEVLLTKEGEEKRTYRLDLRDWQLGIYIVKVTSKKGIKHVKIIKE